MVIVATTGGSNLCHCVFQDHTNLPVLAPPQNPLLVECLPIRGGRRILPSAAGRLSLFLKGSPVKVMLEGLVDYGEAIRCLCQVWRRAIVPPGFPNSIVTATRVSPPSSGWIGVVPPRSQTPDSLPMNPE